jgi:hypothetical protein
MYVLYTVCGSSIQCNAVLPKVANTHANYIASPTATATYVLQAEDVVEGPEDVPRAPLRISEPPEQTLSQWDPERATWVVVSTVAEVPMTCGTPDSTRPCAFVMPCIGNGAMVNSAVYVSAYCGYNTTSSLLLRSGDAAAWMYYSAADSELVWVCWRPYAAVTDLSAWHCNPSDDCMLTGRLPHCGDSRVATDTGGFWYPTENSDDNGQENNQTHTVLVPPPLPSSIANQTSTVHESSTRNNSSNSSAVSAAAAASDTAAAAASAVMNRAIAFLALAVAVLLALSVQQCYIRKKNAAKQTRRPTVVAMNHTSIGAAFSQDPTTRTTMLNGLKDSKLSTALGARRNAINTTTTTADDIKAGSVSKPTGTTRRSRFCCFSSAPPD